MGVTIENKLRCDVMVRKVFGFLSSFSGGEGRGSAVLVDKADREEKSIAHNHMKP
jgi:hypothetical protein